MNRRNPSLIFLIASLAGWGHAFDTGPHFDLIRDSLGAEGFGEVAIQSVQVHSWFVDLYESDAVRTYEGHVSWLEPGVESPASLLPQFRSESWSKAVVEAADRLHFDSKSRSSQNEALEAEWRRLAGATRANLIRCAQQNDLDGALAVLGISLHAVQDFYAHTNWIESRGRRATDGHDGPGWAAIAAYGSHPTWFDVPAAARARTSIYSRAEDDPGIGHGDWNAPARGAGRLAMAKDWPGRPAYRDAYLAAYLASRQWVQSARHWLNNEPFWSRMMAYAQTGRGELAHDQAGAFELSVRMGHWSGNGNGRAHRNAILEAGKRYFEALKPLLGNSKTTYRAKFEEIVVSMQAPDSVLSESSIPVASSRRIASEVEAIEARVLAIRALGAPVAETLAKGFWRVDWMAAGQRFRSGQVAAENPAGFESPLAPFTFLKFVPKSRSAPIPLASLRLTVHGLRQSAPSPTARLRISERHALPFPRAKKDESGGSAFDFAFSDETTLDDLKFVQIERVSGTWSWAGVRVEVNGRTAFRNEHLPFVIDREGASWRAPALSIPARRTIDVPMSIGLQFRPLGVEGEERPFDLANVEGRRTGLLLFSTFNRTITLDAEGVGRVTLQGTGETDPAQVVLALETLSFRPPEKATPSDSFEAGRRGAVSTALLTGRAYLRSR